MSNYFGTHCHMCHEAVEICKCVKSNSPAVVPLDKKEMLEHKWELTDTGTGLKHYIGIPSWLVPLICRTYGTSAVGTGKQEIDYFNLALEILIPYMNYVNDPKNEQLKPFGIPNDITLNGEKLLKAQRSPARSDVDEK